MYVQCEIIRMQNHSSHSRVYFIAIATEQQEYACMIMLYNVLEVVHCARISNEQNWIKLGSLLYNTTLVACCNGLHFNVCLHRINTSWLSNQWLQTVVT